jgi:hypothetical protein
MIVVFASLPLPFATMALLVAGDVPEGEAFDEHLWLLSRWLKIMIQLVCCCLELLLLAESIVTLVVDSLFAIMFANWCSAYGSLAAVLGPGSIPPQRSVCSPFSF